MKHSPMPYLLFGAAALVFLIAVIIPLEIATSEAFFSGGSAVSLHPNLGIYQQGYDLLTGNLSSDKMAYALPSWGSEFFQFVFILVFEVVHEAIKKNNPTLARWFRTGTYVIVIFNIITNYLYAPGITLQAHIGFTLILSTLAFFTGWIAIASLEHGFHIAHGPTTGSASPKP